MQLIKNLNRFLKEKASKLLNLISLSFTYFLGIGPTSILGKILGKKFLLTNNCSTWRKNDYQTNIEKMF